MRGPSLLVAAAAALCALGLAASSCQDETVPPTEPSFGGCCVAGGGEGGDGGTSGTGATTTVALVTGVYSPQALALDSSNVYWTTSKGVTGGGLVGDASAGTGALESVPRGGGGVTDVVAGLSSPGSVAVADTTLFFSVVGTEGGALDAYTLGDNASVQVATATSAQIPVASYENTIYWATGTGSTLSVFSAPATGGVISTVVSEAASYEPIALATNGGSVFVLATGGGSSYLLSGAIGGNGKLTELWHAEEAAAPSLAVDGSTIYWSLGNTADDGGEVLAMGDSPGTPEVLADHIDNAGALGVASNTVYFLSNSASGAVLSVSTGGGGITTLASGLDYPSCLAVADAVYVGTASTITRVPF